MENNFPSLSLRFSSSWKKQKNRTTPRIEHAFSMGTFYDLLSSLEIFFPLSLPLGIIETSSLVVVVVVTLLHRFSIPFGNQRNRERGTSHKILSFLSLSHHYYFLFFFVPSFSFSVTMWVILECIKVTSCFQPLSLSLSHYTAWHNSKQGSEEGKRREREGWIASQLMLFVPYICSPSLSDSLSLILPHSLSQPLFYFKATMAIIIPSFSWW